MSDVRLPASEKRHRNYGPLQEATSGNETARRQLIWRWTIYSCSLSSARYCTVVEQQQIWRHRTQSMESRHRKALAGGSMCDEKRIGASPNRMTVSRTMSAVLPYLATAQRATSRLDTGWLCAHLWANKCQRHCRRTRVAVQKSASFQPRVRNADF